MDAIEAFGIIQKANGRDPRPYSFYEVMAIGYLRGLEGPEVTALVTALENIYKNCTGDAVIYAGYAIDQHQSIINGLGVNRGPGS